MYLMNSLAAATFFAPFGIVGPNPTTWAGTDQTVTHGLPPGSGPANALYLRGAKHR